MARAENFLEQCLAWQEVIDAQSSVHAMDEAGLEAKAKIVAPAGSASMLVHGEHALVACADSPRTSSLSDGALLFREVIARGALGHVDYLRMAKKGMLAWTVKSPEIKNHRELSVEAALAENDDDMEGGTEVAAPLKRELYVPMYFPVSGIISAIFAGRNPYRLSPRFYQDVVF